jgi:hypothetical protein
MHTTYTYVGLVVVLVLIVFACGCSGHEGFAVATGMPVAGPKAGTFYYATDRKGTSRPASFRERVVLHEQRFRVWSCETEPEVVLRVTADGLPYQLHLRSPGRIDNLPAMLGGLPAHENYTRIFNSGRRVMVEFVPLVDAQQAVEAGLSHCIATSKYSEGVCHEEYSPL